MKKNILIITFILGITLAFLPSCDNSGYSLNRQWISIATVVPHGQNAYSLLLDDGRSLWPAASAVPFFRPRENQRVFINYTLLSDRHSEFDHLIRVNDIWNILTKQAIELTTANADSIGNDPIRRVSQMWAGGDFLNISFLFNPGAHPHMLNLVKNTTVEYPESDVIHLEFRYNTFGSVGQFTREGFVCFDLRPFQVEGKNEVKFTIKVNEPAGERVIEVVYRYNRAAESAMDMPIPVITSEEYF